jgi:hypothetical protein
MMSPPEHAALKAAAKAAWQFTLPMVELAQTRTRNLARGLPMNTFGHGAKLADHRARTVTTPNNDTLYSVAFVDLSDGPVSIVLPRSGDRYLSLALMDAYTNNFAVLGTRTTGADGGFFTLVGPVDAAEGPNVVRSPTRHVWALGRVLVAGPEDMAAARLVQCGISMQGPRIAPPAPCADRRSSWADYFTSAAGLMAINPPPVTDWAMLARMAPLGLAAFDPARFSPSEVAAIEAGIAEARMEARNGGLAGGTASDGWVYPASRLGAFEQEYGLRAAIALGALAALPPAEAMYMRSVGDLEGGLHDGSRPWRLHFPRNAPLPVDSFWSLSLYEATDDGQFFFAENPLGRFAIGDRSPGLTYNADLSLDIWISHRPPPELRRGNWLPAPAGPFALFMRAYLPRPDLLEGRFRLPPVRPDEEAA